MKAVTDSGPTVENQEKPEVIQNLFTFLELVSTPDVYKHYDDLYNSCQIRYGDLKKQLAADINAYCAPIRERIAREGAERAREHAQKTLQEVRHIIGFR